MNLYYSTWTTALADGTASADSQLLAVCIAVVVAFLLQFLFNRFIVKFVGAIIKSSKTKWDDYLLGPDVTGALSKFIPVGILYLALPVCVSPKLYVYSVASEIINVSSILLIAVVLSKVLGAINDKMQAHDKGARSLTGIFQMFKLVVWGIVLLIVAATLLDKNPNALLTGLGASAAVLMLVFQDTIVGLVSGVQLAAYDMIRKNDWVVMEKNGINGIVIDVNLNTVKVRNWDNSIVTVPPHTLIADSFKNYRHMQKAKSRRITITLNIDINSIEIVDEGLVADLQSKGMYVSHELIEPNGREVHVKDSVDTNLYLFNCYVEEYMKNLEYVNSKDLIMVRTEQPSSSGLPIEAYCHIAYTDWRQYEHARSRIVQHLIAVLPNFGLRIFQFNSGYDMGKISVNIDKS